MVCYGGGLDWQGLVRHAEGRRTAGRRVVGG